MSTLLAVAIAASALGQQQPVYPEGAAIPRNLTPAEARYLATNPIVVPEYDGGTPQGPVWCPGEYEPQQGVLLSWEGPSSWLAILAQMAKHITTAGDADVYINLDNSSELAFAQSSIQAQGANMDRVHFMIVPTDSIWIRDYGPRYIFEGGCRAIVDHTYNRPRPLDDVQPFAFGQYKGHHVYIIPLIHGGGNYHLNSLTQANATKLIVNENPTLTEQQIHGHWQAFQDVDTEFYTPFPTFVDATQHIDMWMQIIDDDVVMISDWPNNPGSTQDQICDAAAISMAAMGYTVHRIVARSVSGIHYTYTNVVICNDIILIPTYTNAQVSGHNPQALASWQAAAPNHTIIQINCEGIVSAAGVMHCIMMHVPKPMGGEIPTAYLRTQNQAPSYAPASMEDICWLADDDKAVTGIDILLSTNSGATYPYTIATGTAHDGELQWTIPDLATARARIKVVARDAAGNSGSDESDADFTITGQRCAADCDGDFDQDIFDYLCFQDAWVNQMPHADTEGDGDWDIFDFLAFQSLYATSPCP